MPGKTKSKKKSAKQAAASAAAPTAGLTKEGQGEAGPSKRIKKEGEQSAQAGDREATPMPMPITQASDTQTGVSTSAQPASSTGSSTPQGQQSPPAALPSGPTAAPLNGMSALSSAPAPSSPLPGSFSLPFYLDPPTPFISPTGPPPHFVWALVAQDSAGSPPSSSLNQAVPGSHHPYHHQVVASSSSAPSGGQSEPQGVWSGHHAYAPYECPHSFNNFPPFAIPSAEQEAASRLNEVNNILARVAAIKDQAETSGTSFSSAAPSPHWLPDMHARVQNTVLRYQLGEGSHRERLVARIARVALEELEAVAGAEGSV